VTLSPRQECENFRFRHVPAARQGERIGRNPKTGVEVPITRAVLLTFRASQMLKDRICTGD
jgi:nucleoid DNA-binding protein